MISKRSILWLAPLTLYLIFFAWYTNLSGPLSDEEIDGLITQFKSNGATEDRLANIRRFMQEDTGNDFVMINLLDMRENVPDLPATGPNATSGDLISHYMEHMYPAQFARASHPVFFGQAVADALDLSGVEGAEHWEQGALFRYRSRRDVMEISANPTFLDRHDYKLGALEKTIAYPVEPTLYLSDLRFILALLLFSLVSLLDLVIYRR